MAVSYPVSGPLLVKVHSHATSAFAFFFDFNYPALENANVKCKHHHFMAYIPFLTSDAKAEQDSFEVDHIINLNACPFLLTVSKSEVLPQKSLRKLQVSLYRMFFPIFSQGKS